MTRQVIENKEVILTSLKKRSEFLRVASKQKKWISPAIIIQMASQPAELENSEELIRVGFTASKKVGNAVQRNKAKRRLREVARQVLSEKGVKKHDYVLIARNTILDYPFADLIRDMKWSLKRLHDPKGKNRS